MNKNQSSKSPHFTLLWPYYQDKHQDWTQGRSRRNHTQGRINMDQKVIRKQEKQNKNRILTGRKRKEGKNQVC